MGDSKVVNTLIHAISLQFWCFNYISRITSEGPVSKRYETGIESSESTLNLIHKAFDTYFLASLANK